MSKESVVPYMDAIVLGTAEPLASSCSMTGFTARPATYCRLTHYFEPVGRHLFFALENLRFSIVGRLCEIGGGRLRLDVSEARGETGLESDACDAVRIGLLALLVHANDYFPGKAHQVLLPTPSGYPLICRAVPSVGAKGWLALSELAFDGSQGEWFTGQLPPLLDGFDVRAFSSTYIEGSLRAMETLETGSHWRDLFVLLQCAIDNLAWLSRPLGQEHVNCSDFCLWVHRYMRLRGNAPLTAGEVYAWRCQWVHTYGGQAPKGSGLALADQLSEDYLKDDAITIVGVRNLLTRYRVALRAFATHCSLDVVLRDRVNMRLAEMPGVRPFPPATDGQAATPKG